MLTRIQHAAIVSENFVREAKFYEAAFGMKRSKPGSEEEQKAIRTNYAVSISDGYVGVTVIGRKPGYVPGLHHFGVDVDDVDEAIARIKKDIPKSPCSSGHRTGPSPPSAPMIPKAIISISPRKACPTGAMFIRRKQATRTTAAHSSHQIAGHERAGDRGVLPRSVRLERSGKSPRRSQFLSYRRQA